MHRPDDGGGIHLGLLQRGYTALYPRRLKTCCFKLNCYIFSSIIFSLCSKKKSKAVPLHAMEAFGGRGGIAPTHSRPRH
jgi:hypothetical protein